MTQDLHPEGMPACPQGTHGENAYPKVIVAVHQRRWQVCLSLSRTCGGGSPGLLFTLNNSDVTYLMTLTLRRAFRLTQSLPVSQILLDWKALVDGLCPTLQDHSAVHHYLLWGGLVYQKTHQNLT